MESFFVLGHLSTFVELEVAFEAGNVSLTFFDIGELPNGQGLAYCSRVPSPEGENLVGERKEQSMSHRTVPRSSAISPKVTEPKDAEGKSKTVMKMTKGRIADWIGDPD
uniref:Uncharacterized protein n=1 Tax=Solanum tuberosum TaxID=4113 RepID=M1DV44_SOLTU